MPSTGGVRKKLSLPRRWISDLMAVSRNVPRVSIDRVLDVSPLAAARRRVPDPPSWTVLITKAYAIVSQRMPALRQSYVSFPWPHLYQADESIATVTVARDYEGEPAVFLGRLSEPDRQPLRQLSELVSGWKTCPVEQVPTFRRLIKYARYPWPVRRLLWHLAMGVSGDRRVRLGGTFGVTALGNSGCRAVHMLGVSTTIVSFGPISETGRVDLQISFDHRVLDGMAIAEALIATETVLNHELTAELLAEGGLSRAA